VIIIIRKNDFQRHPLHNWPHRLITFAYCKVENESLSSRPVWLAYSLRDPKHWLGEGGAGEKVIMLQPSLSPFSVRGLIKHPLILQCSSLGPCSCVVLHYGRAWRLLAVRKLLWQPGFSCQLTNETYRTLHGTVWWSDER